MISGELPPQVCGERLPDLWMGVGRPGAARPCGPDACIVLDAAGPLGRSQPEESLIHLRLQLWCW
eukprot:6940840-Heterocapsa_arctica.AAC.1